jgi:hypothetical protein
MKQDRIHPRTPADLQRKYGKKVIETAEQAGDAKKEASQATQDAAAAVKKASELEAKLELTVKVNENGEVVSEINGVANVIKFLANCISIQSDNFTLAENGKVVAKGIVVDGGSIVLKMSNGGYVRIGETVDVLAVDTEDFTEGGGSRVGILPSAIQFSSGEARTSTLPIQFAYVNGAYQYSLVGDWYIGNVKLSDLVSRIEALEG